MTRAARIARTVARETLGVVGDFLRGTAWLIAIVSFAALAYFAGIWIINGVLRWPW